MYGSKLYYGCYNDNNDGLNSALREKLEIVGIHVSSSSDNMKIRKEGNFLYFRLPVFPEGRNSFVRTAI